MKKYLQKITSKIWEITERIFEAYEREPKTYATEEEALWAALHECAICEDWGPITQEEFDKCQKMLEEMENR